MEKETLRFTFKILKMKPQGPEKIFTPTSCLNKDQLMLYSRNELNAAERHLAEMHLVDCELCSDALEGFALLSGQVIVTNTMAEVKKLTHTPVHRAKNKLYWLAAASLVVIIGTTFYLFKMADKPNSEKLAEEKNITVQAPSLTVPVNTNDKETTQVNRQAHSFPTVNPGKSEQETPVAVEKIVEAVEDAETPAAEQKMNITEPAMTGAIKSLGKTSDYSIEEKANVGIKAATDESETIQPYSRNQNITSSSNQDIRYIEGFKTINYKDENPWSDSILVTDRTGLAARFESEQKKKEQKDLIDNDLHLVGYHFLLAEGIRKYKNGAFQEASSIFDQIIRQRKTDENALFYGALSVAGTGRNEEAVQYLHTLLKNPASPFYEEARWHMALILLKDNNQEAARDLLQKIYKDSGFYSQKAFNKLKELK